MRTGIIDADWVVAWDEAGGRHVYRRGLDVVFEDDAIVHLGPGYDGPLDRRIAGQDVCVMPGLVHIHGHPTNQPITRGVREEMGNPRMYMSALYDRTGLWSPDDAGMRAGCRVAFAELMKSGVTTTIDYAIGIPEGWIDLLVESGLRVYAAPYFRDAAWRVVNDSRLEYDWDEDAGRAQFARCLALVDAAEDHPSSLLRGAIAPGQVDTCTPETLKRSFAIARERGLMWQTHAAQTVIEFHEMIRRHGRTPLQWLGDLGVLGPRATVAHCIFSDESSWVRWHARDDLALLADTGTTVAHCPLVFARYGQTMESLGGYLRAGVHVGIGTDTAPHNILEEMRVALICSRIAGRNIQDVSTTDVFNAATIAGARAFGRDDIGRLAVGAKADIVLLDLTHPQMRPCRDPLRNLIYTAADRAVRDVFVDGRPVVEDGEVLTIDVEAALAELSAAQGRAEASVPARDGFGRSGHEVSPLVLPLVAPE